MGQGVFETLGYIWCGREEGGNVEVFGTEALLSGGKRESVVWETGELNCLAKALAISLLCVGNSEEQVIG